MRADVVRLTCEAVAERLPAVVGGEVVADAEVVRHVDSCLRCQAELARYRRVLRALRALRTEVLEPAPGLLADILVTLEQAGERQAMRSLLRRHQVAYIGGIAAATAAGAAGAIVLTARARHRRMRLAG